MFGTGTYERGWGVGTGTYELDWWVTTGTKTPGGAAHKTGSRGHIQPES